MLKRRGTQEVAEPPAWADWKLDKTFFKSLSRYNANHPETTLDRVLDSIRTGLENNQPLIDVIPDNPFPARSLVTALAHLVKLGISVTRAQATVRDFAETVVAWVMEIHSAFESTVGGHFTWTTWRNLLKMRDLIEEICRWANARLNDKRWSRIGNGMMIASEIAEFNARIVEAKGLFADLTLINLSGGIDAIVGAIRLLLQRQDNISNEIQKIRDKQREQFSYILKELEAQKQADIRRQFLSQTLSPHVVANPTYDQQGKQPCDENTRMQVLAEITEWVNDTSSESRNFLWLTGDPGCGKSAITASIARECKDKDILWAQFFINRNNIETTDPNTYFPSIARQLVDHSVDVERVIHATLKRKPSLMDSISPVQAAKLFVDAIGVASELYPDRPVVVVIDGLDETDRRRLKDTANIFSRLFQDLSRHHNAKIFVSSRTEDDIRNPFTRHMDDKHVKHIHLDTAEKSSIDDVSAFLRKKIAQIVEENDLNWEEWPGERRMELLCQRAAGLFIWAVTVTKFLQEQIDTMGSECLNEVLNMLNAETLSDINTLYSIILRQTHKDSSSVWEFEKFRQIVGAIVVLCEPLCLENLSTLLDLRQTASSSPVDLVNFVRRLRTVLVAGTQAIDMQTVPRLHKSFFEFITSQQAEPQFRIELEAANREVGARCLAQFCDAHATIPQTWSIGTLPECFLYAFRFWFLHLRQTGVPISGMLIQDDLSLTQADCFKILEQSSNDRHLGPIHISFTQDQSRILTAFGDTLLQWDAATGRELKDAHTVFHGHTDYVSSVAFSPKSDCLVSGSSDKTSIVWSLKHEQDIASLKSHVSDVRCVRYSPNGSQIATSSDDFTVRIWDAHTHILLSSLDRHTNPVRSIAFCSDGKHIVSGSDDNTVCLWLWEDPSKVWTMKGHSRAVNTVTCSPCGDEVASSSDDHFIRFWDIKTHGPSDEPPLRLSRVNNLQFSPLGTYLAAIEGVDGNTIYLWKPTTRKPDAIFSGNDLHPPVRRVCSLAISPDERCLVLGCSDHSIRVVDVLAGPLHALRFVGHLGWVMSVAISPDGKHIASGSMDNTTRIWDMPGAVVEAVTLDDPVTPFTSFSPDGTLVLRASPDKTLHLWNSSGDQNRAMPLQGVTGEMKFVSFSPDGSRIAGVSTETAIYVWDVRTYKLIASSVTDFISQITSISFTPDSRHLLTTYLDSPTYLWEEQNGKLTGADISVCAEPSQITPPNFFQLDPLHTTRLEDITHRSRGLRWISGRTYRPGLWVFFRGHVIRAREDGSITVAFV